MELGGDRGGEGTKRVGVERDKGTDRGDGGEGDREGWCVEGGYRWGKGGDVGWREGGQGWTDRGGWVQTRGHEGQGGQEG